MRVSRPNSADTLGPGERIGPFVLLAPMGVGGSGRIWAVARVGQLGFNKRMVLKIMRHDKLSSARARERFDREACLGGCLSHPNVRAVHDLGSHEGRPFMAMSWVDASLAELLEHAPGRALEPEVVCWIGMQCCSALEAAHAYIDPAGEPQAIVHRDVSPGNILLTADGHALLADLTAPARDPRSSPRGGASPERRFFGSLAYAAPEALRQELLDGRSDLFSLGCVLYESLTGVPAFEGDDEPSVVFQILEGAPEPLARRVPAVAADLAAVVHRCLERQPERRFQSAPELRAALSACCRAHSAFRLEQRAASVVREVLGSRIRAREEAMHLAFQRFAPSPLERTDTLPMVRTASDGGGTTLNLVSRPAPSEAHAGDHEPSHSGAPMAISRHAPKPRRPLWALGVAAASLLTYSAYRWSPASSPGNGSGGDPAGASVDPAGSGPPEVASGPPAVGSAGGVGAALHAADREGGGAADGASPATNLGVAGGRAAGAGASVPGAVARDEAPAAQATRAGAAPNAAAHPSRSSTISTRNAQPSATSASRAERGAAGVPNDSAAARERAPREPAVGSTREPKPFIFHFDGDNPYEGAPARASRAPRANAPKNDP